MRKKILLMFVIALSIFALLLCGCDQLNGGNNNNNTTPKDENNTNDSDKEEGWETKELDPKTMYLDFMSGFTNIAYDLSADMVKKNKQITADACAMLSVNENKFWLSFKGKYDCTDPQSIREKAIFQLTLSSEEKVTEDTQLMSVCMYNDELYIALGDNKVKFSLENSNWTEVYPFEMTKVSAEDLDLIAGGFVSIVKLNGDPKVKWRRNSSKEEYKISLDINIKDTLNSLFANLDKIFGKNKSKADSIAEIKSFAASLLGISVDKLNKGEIPECSLTLDYQLSGKQISALTMAAKVDISNSTSNLIKGDELNIEFDIKEVKTTNDWANGVKIEFVSNRAERESYTNYKDAIYSLSIPIEIYDDNHKAVDANYELDVMTKIFQGDGSNYIFFEYYNTKTKQVDRAIYVYNNKAYLYSVNPTTGNSEFVYRCNINLSDLAVRLFSNDLNGNKEFDIYALVAYALRNATISTTGIKIAINSDFFTKVWYNFYDMVDYLGNQLDWDDNQEIDEFIQYLTTNEVIYEFAYDNEELLEIIDEDSTKISRIIANLAEADEIFDAAEEEPEVPEENQEEQNPEQEQNQE